MKNPNQADGKSLKNSSATPEQNGTHAPLPALPGGRPSPLAIIAGDPLGGRDSFEIELDWIGDSMEPEVYQGNLAMVSRRESMTPCLTELVLGLLKNGTHVFGAFQVSDDNALLRIDFINDACPSGVTTG